MYEAGQKMQYFLFLYQKNLKIPGLLRRCASRNDAVFLVIARKDAVLTKQSSIKYSRKKNIFLVLFLFIQSATAHMITVEDVKVSVRDNSAAAAREKALEQAHILAFQKLMGEKFPEKLMRLPSQEILMSMVSNFSIDREKATPQSYTASLRFQFEEAQVQSWLQQNESALHSSAQPLHTTHEILKVRAFYTTYSEWKRLKKTLENFSGVQEITLLTLSPQQADMELRWEGEVEKLRHHLLQGHFLLSPQEEGWIIKSDTHNP
jgi:hypothetical protein